MFKRFIIIFLCICVFADLALPVYAENDAEEEIPYQSEYAYISRERLLADGEIFISNPTRASEDYRVWAQADSRWGSIAMGSSGYTVAQIGCTISSVTKLIIQCGLRDSNSFNIATLANWLNSNGGYTSGGALYWGKPSACVSGFNNYGDLLDYGTYSSSNYNSQIIAWIAAGYHMTINVNSGGHWIAVDEAKSLATGQVYIMDSLSGSQNADLTLVSRYSTFNMIHAYTGGTTPYYDPTQPPTIAILSTDHTTYEVDETVAFSIAANGTQNNLWIYCPDGETLTYTDVGSRYELAFGMSGHFQALVETWNGVGSKCSERIDFYVGNPTYAYLSTNKTNYAVDESVYFTIEADGIQNNLWIYCPNGDTLTYTDVGASYDLGFGMSGHFQALVETWNGIGSKCSDRIDFYVGNQTITVTFNPNGGTVSPTTKTVTIGSTYGTLPTPACTNYNFDGWYTSALGGSKVTASTTVTATSNHTLYAHWTHVCANGHNYSYTVSTPPTTTATGTLTGTCSRCGVMTTATLPKLTTTDYNYSIIQVATCIANGTGRYTWKTTIFGTFSFDVTIPKTGHSYSATVTPPTCTEQGYTTHTCSRCNDSYVDSFVPVLGHAWDNGAVTTQPTETTEGAKTFTCTRCGATKTESIPATGDQNDKPCDGGEG